MELKTETLTVAITDDNITISESYGGTMTLVFDSTTMEYKLIKAIADESVDIEPIDKNPVIRLAYILLTTRLIVSLPNFAEKYFGILQEVLDTAVVEDDEPEESILRDMKAAQEAKEILLKDKK